MKKWIIILKIKIIKMAIINFECKKCKEAFNCETGEITFGNILGFEKDIICPNCGKLTKEEILLTEFGQTQISMLYSKGERIMKGHGIYENLFSNDNNENDEDLIVIPEKIGRNEPCPCGSGKKYKKCC